MSVIPTTVEIVLTMPSAFLVYPENQDFVDGRSRFPVRLHIHDHTYRAAELPLLLLMAPFFVPLAIAQILLESSKILSDSSLSLIAPILKGSAIAVGVLAGVDMLLLFVRGRMFQWEFFERKYVPWQVQQILKRGQQVEARVVSCTDDDEDSSRIHILFEIVQPSSKLPSSPPSPIKCYLGRRSPPLPGATLYLMVTAWGIWFVL